MWSLLVLEQNVAGWSMTDCNQPQSNYHHLHILLRHQAKRNRLLQTPSRRAIFKQGRKTNPQTDSLLLSLAKNLMARNQDINQQVYYYCLVSFDFRTILSAIIHRRCVVGYCNFILACLAMTDLMIKSSNI
mmetsp:Transcript_65406/g.175469  ORF Transcript_65406/g.175469 Transcript_65406/m.175469 type:complete len:131 (+) Transcript_65406:381-773(+)